MDIFYDNYMPSGRLIQDVYGTNSYFMGYEEIESDKGKNQAPIFCFVHIDEDYLLQEGREKRVFNRSVDRALKRMDDGGEIPDWMINITGYEFLGGNFVRDNKGKIRCDAEQRGLWWYHECDIRPLELFGEKSEILKFLIKEAFIRGRT